MLQFKSVLGKEGLGLQTFADEEKRGANRISGSESARLGILTLALNIRACCEPWVRVAYCERSCNGW